MAEDGETEIFTDQPDDGGNDFGVDDIMQDPESSYNQKQYGKN